ncbi:TIGR02710 family CRISPR-associated CARF protein [Evansella tamaricis]|uniref:TIGR02710 family CRISPR-associated protein n=1 Tax=Evansella tamaricis TaxID=2069301 RepID=A0ABS6JL34_9BACI|nr:TIGR02710 family CRISPR-associated CARF protein [Evansella tamaricis]MBU9714373.1 TIGR02710 family CRISPR-associated protein [Evansella tamaricis]
METFQEKSKFYLEIHSKDRKAATDYYQEHLFQQVMEQFLQKVQHARETGKHPYDYEYLIMPVGHDIHPLVLWINSLKPKNVFFICSPETEENVDIIGELTGLRLTQVEHAKVRGSDVKDVYGKIKDYIRNKQIDQADFNKIAIDITGGMKSMVSGCTLAANHLGIDILYIENNGHFPGHKEPQPGLELPTILEDPLEVFGDRDLRTAINKFNSEDFETAIEIFKTIQDRVVNPKPYQAYEHLATGYSHLESMRFREAGEHITKTIRISELLNLKEIPTLKLTNQLIAIEPLTKIHELSDERILKDGKTYWHLFGYLFLMANHYRKQHKADIAALLIYRCLEMITQRLLLLNLDISPFNPDYNKLYAGDLMDKVNEVAKDTFYEYRKIKSFGPKIGLMQGLLILKASEEHLIKDIDLKMMNNFITLRNKSRLAHGFELLQQERVDEFYHRIRGLNNKIWNEHRQEIKEQRSFEEFSKHFGFVNIELNK